MSWSVLVLLLAAVGVTTAYVSPDDQPRYNGQPRQQAGPGEGSGRAKPRGLAEQGAALRAQEAARKRSLRDVSGAYASSGASAGGFQQGGYGYSGNPAPGSFGFPGAGGSPFPYYSFHNQPQQFGPADVAAFFDYLQQMQLNFQQNAMNQGFSGPGVSGGSFSGGSYGDGASAVASIGPQGGYGSAQLTPDLGNRFGGQSGEVPPPRGGNVGVFTSSSSGSSNINGHQTSYKEATSTINDNGKITMFTVRDPPN